MTGTSVSVLIVVGWPASAEAMSMPAPDRPSGKGVPPRLWMRKPSYAFVSGWTPST
jgi:hypothetical protein